MAEDIDRSMREVLPSEGQRKKLKKSTSQTLSEDSLPPTGVNPGLLHCIYDVLITCAVLCFKLI